MAGTSKDLLRVVLVAAAIALIAGVRLLVVHTVSWPAVEPWEGGLPLLVDHVNPGTLVSLGSRPIGRISLEMEPTRTWQRNASRNPRELTVMRIDPTLHLGNQTRFVQKEIDGKQIISVVPGKGEAFRAWDRVTIELPAKIEMRPSTTSTGVLRFH